MKAVNIMMLILYIWIAHGSGSRSAISRSNSKKVIATRKNFIENGRRAEPMGSNPHSYGFAFSVYKLSWGSQKAMVIRRIDRVIFTSRAVSIFITFF